MRVYWNRLIRILSLFDGFGFCFASRLNLRSSYHLRLWKTLTHHSEFKIHLLEKCAFLRNAQWTFFRALILLRLDCPNQKWKLQELRLENKSVLKCSVKWRYHRILCDLCGKLMHIIGFANGFRLQSPDVEWVHDS